MVSILCAIMSVYSYPIIFAIINAKKLVYVLYFSIITFQGKRLSDFPGKQLIQVNYVPDLNSFFLIQ